MIAPPTIDFDDAEGLLAASGREDEIELLSRWPEPVEALS